VIVAEDQLSLAIGKEGQNVRLAARLTGWKIDIKDPQTYARDKEAIEQSILERAEASAKLRIEREAAEQEAQAQLEAEMAALAAEEAALAELYPYIEEEEDEEPANQGDGLEASLADGGENPEAADLIQDEFDDLEDDYENLGEDDYDDDDDPEEEDEEGED
jgi:N utilization substance protein A